MKRIIVSVTNDLVSDNRVHKVCNTLCDLGFKVLLIGRCYRNSPPVVERRYATSRMHLCFRKGPLFYAEFNIRLFFILIFTRFDIQLSNDLDTLPANILAAKLKRKPVFYDSHEYFTEVPELINRQHVQRVWQHIEKWLLPQVTSAYTACGSIADVYTRKYNIVFHVVRNVPEYYDTTSYRANNQSGNKRLWIIYQGALNVGRGLHQAIEAMRYIPEADLILAGSGDIEDELKKFAAEVSPQNVIFHGRVPFEELAYLTRSASIGISLEEDVGLNYRYALPNKLFDYIQARIPVIVSNLPEMKGIVEKYMVGLIADSNHPEYLAGLFRKALFDQSQREAWRKNLETAAGELNWKNERKIIEEIFGGI